MHLCSPQRQEPGRRPAPAPSLHHPRVPGPWRRPGPAVLLPGTSTVLTRHVLPHVANVKSHLVSLMTTGHSRRAATLLILGRLLMNF